MHKQLLVKHKARVDTFNFKCFLCSLFVNDSNTLLHHVNSNTFDTKNTLLYDDKKIQTGN